MRIFIFFKKLLYNFKILLERYDSTIKMNEKNVKNAVFYILERAERQEIPIGLTRLIKLLYLLDIENYRSQRKTFTELDWTFYKYGPYAFEIEEFLENIGVTEEEIPIKGGRVLLRLGIDHQEEIDIGIEKKAILDSLIEEWGDASLSELLDYVYFDTEPMMGAQTRGERLEFGSIKPKSYYAVKKYEVDEKRGKEIIQKIKQWELSKKSGLQGH
jgi:hypothetical protein